MPDEDDLPFCQHWISNGRCGVKPASLFSVGARCEAHTPARLAGREDIDPDPTMTLDALRSGAGRMYNYNRSDTALRDEQTRRKGQAVSAARRKKWRDATDA